MKVKKANKLLNEWTTRLGLQDWVIHLNINQNPVAARLHDASGHITIEPVNKCGRIDIIAKKFYGNRIIPFDFEKTLVHELLHLKFSIFEVLDNELYQHNSHTLLNDMARAMVMAKRGEVER